MTFEAHEEKNSSVKPPSEFLQGSIWKAFNEGAVVFFNLVRGQGHIPLAYENHEDKISDPTMVNDNEHQRLIAVKLLKVLSFQKIMARFLITLHPEWLRGLHGPGCSHSILTEMDVVHG
jgi:hypothetical protein